VTKVSQGEGPGRVTKRIGIVAVSAEGAALCYRAICAEGAALLGPHGHPEIVMHTYPLADYMAPIEAGRWDEVGRMLLASAEKLRGAGAEFLVCPDNTAHQGLDLVRDRSPLPWLHIAEEVAAEAARQRFRKVLVLGTRYLMEGPVYPGKLRAAGIAHEIPDVAIRERINRHTMEELVYGRFEDATRAYFVGVIRDFKARGADAVALSCTEFPLLVSAADSPLPVLDSTRLLARAALREATR
jgi:aspartate racemase